MKDGRGKGWMNETERTEHRNGGERKGGEGKWEREGGEI